MTNNNEKMFDNFASQYDVYNNLISWGTHHFVKALCLNLLEIEQNSKILDLCTGTGDIARELQKRVPNAKIFGLDISEKMLEIAQEKSNNIEFKKGSISEIPFESELFDIITISFGLRNVSDKEKAFSEMHRVLKPNGQLLHIDLGKPDNFAQKIFNLNTFIAKKFFTKKMPSEVFLNSIENFYSPKELIQQFEKNGFMFKKRTDPMLGVISAQLFIKNK